jgi:hypothetical protein
MNSDGGWTLVFSVLSTGPHPHQVVAVGSAGRTVIVIESPHNSPGVDAMSQEVVSGERSQEGVSSTPHLLPKAHGIRRCHPPRVVRHILMVATDGVCGQAHTRSGS